MEKVSEKLIYHTTALTLEEILTTIDSVGKTISDVYDKKLIVDVNPSDINKYIDYLVSSARKAFDLNSEEYEDMGTKAGQIMHYGDYLKGQVEKSIGDFRDSKLDHLLD